MTMRVKFAGTSADEGFTDIFWKPLNLQAPGSVLEDRTLVHQELREREVGALEVRALEVRALEVRALEVRALEVRARDARAEGLPATELPVAASSSARQASQRLVEPDALTEMLAEMSLSTLLYYVLAGEGTDRDESS
ncbi:MAG: hypothetical protein ABR971_06945 [Acidobacteriaceae bacterium]